jgi:hypothetical protein
MLSRNHPMRVICIYVEGLDLPECESAPKHHDPPMSCRSKTYRADRLGTLRRITASADRLAEPFVGAEPFRISMP